MHQEIKISGLILAGGEARRMDYQDKGFVKWRNKPLIEQVSSRFSPQVAELLISCNRNTEQYRAFGKTVSDEKFYRFGPLAGIYSGLIHCQYDYLVVVPVDSPLLPLNLVSTLWEKQRQTEAQIVFAQTPTREQPLFCLLKKSLKNSLNEYLESGNRKVYQWMKQQAFQLAAFDEDGPFTNFNSPDQFTETPI